MALSVAYLQTLLFIVLSKRVRPQPNIIFFLIDDMGWNDISLHGGNDFSTPNIDALALDGLQLDNYYVQSQCTPTRSAFMSGRYPIHSGLQDGVIDPTSPYGLPLLDVLLPQDLKRAGYDTHLIGKWHLGFYTPEYLPTVRGFDTFLGYYLGSEDYFFHNRTYNGVSGYDLLKQTTPIFRNNTYSTYVFGNESLDILKYYDAQSDPNPFFLFVSFQTMHTPLQAPADIVRSFFRTIEDQNRRNIAAMMTVLDDVIGQLTSFLQSDSKTDMWDDTMIIFSTDNGGAVNVNASNFPLRGSKTTLWEGGVKGAAFISGGWLAPTRRGQSMKALMHVTDFYPTLCSIAGIRPSDADSLDGYNQRSNIQKGASDVYSPRAEILLNIDPVGCTVRICGGIRAKQYKLVVGWQVIDTDDLCRSGWCPLPEPDENLASIQCSAKGNYDYPVLNAHYMSRNCPFNNEPCLYDIDADPCEYYDIKDAQPDIYQSLYAKLLQYNATMATPLSSLYPPNATAANPANFDGFWSPWSVNS
jgi:arylsulfatase B/arylsulfatase I/J